ncbi:unnamed protein product [Prorocentrum cordatum]|uniref:Uncharacterized protein n=1 Tax=Prorocentrum cordatum TaxID=2364126 RepID=A0ABN9W978_9DINO|nr:unnamed protein product [Polarella glacialis]
MATLDSCAASVLAFAAAMGVGADCWVRRDLPLIDSLLEEYFEMLFLDGGSKGKGALSGWGKLGPDVTSEPLSWAAAALMAQYLAGLGTEAGLQAARGLAVQFDTYLRPGELLDLLVPCCLLPQPSACSGCSKMGLVVGASAVVMGDATSARVTKTGLQDDTVLIDGQSRAGVAGAFVALVHAAQKARQGWVMFLHAHASYNRALKQAAAAVGVPNKVTSHLPRHGGPSEDYLRGARTLPDIQARGRWASARSVQRCQKSGRALASFRRLPAAVKAEAKRAEAEQLSFPLWVQSCWLLANASCLSVSSGWPLELLWEF